jgi:hypothetical protein
MKVIIVTRGRDDSMQVTADFLREAGVPFTFARTEGDETPLTGDCEWHVASHVGEKRQSVLDRHDRFIMLDDDLTFMKVDDEGRPVRCSAKELRHLMQWMWKLTADTPLVGLEQRFMIHQKSRPFNDKWGPLLHVFGINKSLLAGDERFDRVKGHEDWDFVLQVRSNGLKTLSISSYCHSDRGNFYRKGGCSLWRTKELCMAEAEVLRALWPDYITIGTRGEGIASVRCAWKKLRQEVEAAQ